MRTSQGIVARFKVLGVNESVSLSLFNEAEGWMLSVTMDYREAREMARQLHEAAAFAETAANYGTGAKGGAT